MNKQTLSLIYFSPTGTTRRVLEAMAEGMGPRNLRHIDITLPRPGGGEAIEINAGFALIGVPVYAGRVPLTVIDRLAALKARNVPAAIVVVYGNRAFDDALLELRELSLGAGFLPVAGGAFIGEHSFAGKDAPIALGRPDEKDLATAREFGRKLGLEPGPFDSSRPAKPVQVPGNVPHRERMPHGGIAPCTREELCTLCGTCASVCPTGAVSVDGTVVTDAAACIMCHACVKQCPSGARVMEAEPVKAIVNRLVTNFMDRKEPETFL